MRSGRARFQYVWLKLDDVRASRELAGSAALQPLHLIAIIVRPMMSTEGE
jgi:hypothetical protein